MSPRVLRLREHQTLGGVALEPWEVEQLLGCGARLVVTPSSPGHYDVTAAEMVGTVGLRDLRLVIEPKVPVGRLLGLLTYATRPFELRSEVEIDPRADLLTLMQSLYANLLGSALRRGLVHAYEEQTDRLAAVRGRISVRDLYLRRFGVLPPIDCEYQEYTPDVEVNRRLLAAAVLLARHDRGSAPSAKLLGLAARMGDVSEVRYSRDEVRPLVLDRRWAPYRTALGIAEIVLRHASVELNEGATASLGLLVDMDRLFEDVVVEGLRVLLRPEGKWVRHPGNLHLDVDDRVPIYPDAVWYRRGKPPLVVDAKYKATSMAKREDLYQVTSYCQAIGATRAVVVYAQVDPGLLRVRRGGPVIELVQLDLDCDLGVLDERLRVVADRLRAEPA